MAFLLTIKLSYDRFCELFWRRTQVVKGEVCKTFIQRFESARRLQPEWWNGRHKGLKIPRPKRLYRFKSGLRHHPPSLGFKYFTSEVSADRSVKNLLKRVAARAAKFIITDS